MSALWSALLAVLWPPAAPVFDREEFDDRADRSWWRLLCVLLVIPFTAIWHHAVFYSPRCMLNDFGPEYTPDVVAHWLARDPSLPWAIVVAGALYWAGLSSRRVRLLSAPLFLAFLPLSIWIWDIPFSGRIVCENFHDLKAQVFGVVIRTRYLYLLGALLYVILLTAALARLSPGRSAPVQQPAS